MKGVFFNGTEPVYREDLPAPEAREGYSRIKILRANVCSTDKEVAKGYRPQFRGIMGHEFVGIVDASVSRPDLIGKTVVGELNEGCGDCVYCRNELEKHCADRKVIGMEGRDGCFAEYMLLSDHLIHVVPEGLSPDRAVYCEPLAAALEIGEQLDLKPGMHTALIGDGRLAFMIAQVLHLKGLDLTVIGKHPEKLELFRPYGKLRTARDCENTETLRGVSQEEFTYELVVDATGSESGIHLAAQIVRRRGTILLKSTYAGTANVDLSYFVVNEISIVGSRCGPFEPALELLSKGLVQFPEVEWHELSGWKAAFASKAFKAGFRFS